jgi:hypothetical protein
MNQDMICEEAQDKNLLSGNLTNKGGVIRDNYAGQASRAECGPDKKAVERLVSNLDEEKGGGSCEPAVMNAAAVLNQISPTIAIWVVYGAGTAVRQRMCRLQVQLTDHPMQGEWQSQNKKL